MPLRNPSVLTIAALLVCAAVASAQPTPAPSSYDAVTDRGPRAEPALPAIGGAGYGFVDPVFVTPIRRLTDSTTRPGTPNRSYRTPSGTHQNAWSADGSYFYVVSTDGTIIPFAFDASTGRAARINPVSAGDGGLVVRFYIEPHFSYVTGGVIYGSFTGSGATLRTVDQFDFRTGSYTRLLDLDTLVPGLAGTYIGGIGSSAGPVERIMTFFGGASQDRHFYLTVFDKSNPANRRLLDTKNSKVDGVPTNITLNFNLHAAAIDRTGRYITLYPTSVDRAAPRNADPNYLWDTATDVFTALPSISARSNGHDAHGYGVRVNQDCCASTSWDAAQWQIRSLQTPLVTRDAIMPVLQPKELYLSEHPSWHNASPDRMVPFVTATYRYGDYVSEWRPWDDEIVGVQTNMASDVGAEVWRFAHHRSDVRHDGDPSRISFWYTPRANISGDGRWVLFTSNWEKTLGTDPGAEAGGAARQDVFLLQLKPAATGDADPEPPAPVSTIQISTTSLPAAKRNKPYSATLTAVDAQGSVTWHVAGGALPPGLSLSAASGVISGTSRSNGTFSFTVRATDTVGSATRNLSVTVQK
jgi:hypothetical protein